jgi:plasmid stabilization system protein ParE
MRVSLQSAAIVDVEGARLWYEDRRVGLGARFVAELDRTLAIVAAHPRRFRKLPGDTRWALLRRFPYAVVYRVEADFVTVLAVMHAKSARRLRGRL